MSSPNGPRTGRTGTRRTRWSPPRTTWPPKPAWPCSASGGSAVDAAIAANAVLCVAYPHMAGLGGDGFWLIHDGDGVQALNASGPAAAAPPSSGTGQQGSHHEIPSPRRCGRELTVPGAVDGWREAHERYGRLDWAALFDDAVHWARSGVPVGRSLTDWLAPTSRTCRATTRPPASSSRAARPRDGDRLVNEDLAGSLRGHRDRGAPAGFYEGARRATVRRGRGGSARR
jgi:gamma-glutamyltranspeptidase